MRKRFANHKLTSVLMEVPGFEFGSLRGKDHNQSDLMHHNINELKGLTLTAIAVLEFFAAMRPTAFSEMVKRSAETVIIVVR